MATRNECKGCALWREIPGREGYGICGYEYPPVIRNLIFALQSSGAIPRRYGGAGTVAAEDGCDEWRSKGSARESGDRGESNP